MQSDNNFLFFERFHAEYPKYLRSIWEKRLFFITVQVFQKVSIGYRAFKHLRSQKEFLFNPSLNTIRPYWRFVFFFCCNSFPNFDLFGLLKKYNCFWKRVFWINFRYFRHSSSCYEFSNIFSFYLWFQTWQQGFLKCLFCPTLSGFQTHLSDFWQTYATDLLDLIIFLRNQSKIQVFSFEFSWDFFWKNFSPNFLLTVFIIWKIKNISVRIIYFSGSFF